MDTLDTWRTVIERTLSEYVAGPYRYGDVSTDVVFDRAHDRYLVVDTGWQRGERVYGTIVHVDIRDGLVWVQYDGTDRPVALALVEAGVVAGGEVEVSVAEDGARLVGRPGANPVRLVEPTTRHVLLEPHPL